MYFYEVVKPKLFWRETRIKAKNLPIHYDDDDDDDIDEGKIKAHYNIPYDGGRTQKNSFNKSDIVTKSNSIVFHSPDSVGKPMQRRRLTYYVKRRREQCILK